MSEISVENPSKYGIGLHYMRSLLRDSNSESISDEEIMEYTKFGLNSGVNINFFDTEFNENKTLLYRALEHGKLKLVHFLLENKANPNLTDRNGVSPLHIAAKKGFVHEALLLIESGADVNASSDNGLRPLHYAHNADIAKILIQNNADIHARDDGGRQALHYAKDVEFVKFLIQNGADVQSRDNENYQPLHFAYNPAVAKLLIQKGADVNAVNNDGQTPLHRVIDTPSVMDLTKLYIEKGADVNALDNQGRSVLYLTFDIAVINVLIKNGADVNVFVEDKYLPSLLHRASRYRDIPLIKLLINSGANINVQNESGLTSLYYLVHEKRNMDIVKLMIEKGAEVSSEDVGRTRNPEMKRLLQQVRDVPFQEWLQHCDDVTALKNVLENAIQDNPAAKTVTAMWLGMAKELTATQLRETLLTMAECNEENSANIARAVAVEKKKPTRQQG